MCCINSATCSLFSIQWLNKLRVLCEHSQCGAIIWKMIGIENDDNSFISYKGQIKS